MARYFFHERSVGKYDVDEHGIELPDLDAVRREAVAGARAIIAEAVLTGRLSLEVVFDVVDARGTPVLTLPFSSAVEIDGYDRLPIARRPRRKSQRDSNVGVCPLARDRGQK